MRVERTDKDNVSVLVIMEKTLDASMSADFKAMLHGLVHDGKRGIVLDLAHVTFMDSSALGAMVSALKAMGSQGEIALCSVREPIANILALTRLDRVFKVLPDRDAACNELGVEL
ncbi:MAG: STAS domain-containing protein [Thermodesulfobacteriota bacterium]